MIDQQQFKKGFNSKHELLITSCEFKDVKCKKL